MEIPEIKQQIILATKLYDYGNLETFFEDIANPQEIEKHLDQLLYFLVYYEHEEGVQGFYEIYSDIFELKRVLQTMIKTE